jgi:hypothetical protein
MIRPLPYMVAFVISSLKAERNAGDSQQFDFNPLDEGCPLGAFFRGQHRGEIATKSPKVLLERDTGRAVSAASAL